MAGTGGVLSGEVDETQDGTPSRRHRRRRRRRRGRGVTCSCFDNNDLHSHSPSRSFHDLDHTRTANAQTRFATSKWVGHACSLSFFSLAQVCLAHPCLVLSQQLSPQ